MAAPKGNQYAKGNTGGRPAIYDDERISQEAKALIEWTARDGGLYLDSFARQRGYSRQRLYEWEKSNIEFADALMHARAWQEEKFLTKGLNREWDATFTKYAMARVCGDKWKASWDKEDKEVKSTDVLEFLALLMAQAKGKDKPNADSGT
jgi:hypothetical protein